MSSWLRAGTLFGAIALASLASCGRSAGETASEQFEPRADAAQDRSPGSGGSSSGGSAGRDGERDSAQDASGALDASGPTEDASPCSPSPTGAIPSGWVHFPGVACECDVWLAADRNQMGPAPRWVTTSSGALELQNDWADASHQIVFRSADGDSYQGERLIAFTRDLGPIGGAASVYEQVVVRLPANEIVFRARYLGDAATCRLGTALGQGKALHWVADQRSGSPGSTYAVSNARVDLPVPIYTGRDYLRTAIGAGLVGFVRQAGSVYYFNVGTIPLGVPNPPLESIETLQLIGFVNPILVHDSTFFYGVYESSTTRILAWDKLHGRRVFLRGIPGSPLGSLGLATDGSTLVWIEYPRTADSGAVAQLMKAPFTLDPAALAPVLVRRLDRVGSAWRVGGGYAVAAQENGYRASVLIVRLSDGMAWTLDNDPGSYFGRPLYATDEEVAMEQGELVDDRVNQMPPQSRTIVRYPLARLGPGTPPPAP